ncbi:MAG: hypothetical protein AcusKO_21750 [Acuticoccus sp.]
MLDRDALLSERILQSMRDGVIAIDLTGKIIMFNAAAGAILKRDPADVLGQPFGQEFMLDERFDDFNEIVLKAVYDNEAMHSTEVVIRDGEERIDLHVSSSFLNHEGEGGETERLGVVVVFSDITEHRKRRKLKRLFGEYVDPRIVDQILSRGDDTDSRRADMTISFVDMRDFTGWSERLAARELTDLLNQFLAAVTRPIGEEGGITDKYIGDAAMACWGPPFTDDETQASDACRAALGQIAAVDALRATLEEEGFAGAERLDAVVGLATGNVLTGDIGPPYSRNFTVIGNAVNLAARLQDAAKIYGERILVADETRARAGAGFVYRQLDRITVRGSRKPVDVYAVLGAAGTVADERLERAAAYEAALALFLAADFAGAREGFAALAEEGDRAAKLMLSRAVALVDNPPGPGWDGVWRMGPSLKLA